MSEIDIYTEVWLDIEEGYQYSWHHANNHNYSSFHIDSSIEAEILAIVECIKNVRKYSNGVINIYSTSKKCVNIYNNWLEDWVTTGHIRYKKNSDLWMKVYELKDGNIFMFYKGN